MSNTAQGGADTFVIDINTQHIIAEYNIIADFDRTEGDVLGLYGNIYNQLGNITITHDGTDTFIRMGTDVLAIVLGVTDITTADFALYA